MKSERLAARIGLVLGAGGPLGHAFHAGVLRALDHELGWDAREADVVVGTSAGAQVGALLRAEMSPSDLWARVTGHPMSARGRAVARHYTRPFDDLEPRRLAPASPSYLRRVARRPWRARPGLVASALLPPGRVSLARQVAGLQRVFGPGWPRRRLWITAVELDAGRRVAFGRPGCPTTDVGTAVACSGAVPSVCRPVRVGERSYVDGGVRSATHLDLLDDGDLDMVFVSSPLSMFGAMGLLLRLEMRALARRGVPVVAFEPRGRTRAAMGWNPMSLERAVAVAHAAYASTRRHLGRHRTRRRLGRTL